MARPSCGAGFKEQVRLSVIGRARALQPKVLPGKRQAERAKARLDELVNGCDLLVRRDGRDRYRANALATVYVWKRRKA